MSSAASSTTSPAGTPAVRTDEPLPIRMLHDRVLVDPETDRSERQSSAGLVIPATAAGPKRLTWATVVAKGEHVRQVAVGDRVLYDPEERAEVDLGGTDYVLLRERDVHAVAERSDDAGTTGLYL